VSALPDHPTDGVSEIVHQRHRLGILVVLAEAGRADFGYLKRTLGLTDGNLGRHVQILADSNLVTVRKTFADNRPRTWIEMTPAGRRQLNAELDTMQDILDRLRPS
jgi:DNA-binding MarR family transcriptional regulator